MVQALVCLGHDQVRRILLGATGSRASLLPTLDVNVLDGHGRSPRPASVDPSLAVLGLSSKASQKVVGTSWNFGDETLIVGLDRGGCEPGAGLWSSPT